MEKKKQPTNQLRKEKKRGFPSKSIRGTQTDVSRRHLNFLFSLSTGPTDLRVSKKNANNGGFSKTPTVRIQGITEKSFFFDDFPRKALPLPFTMTNKSSISSSSALSSQVAWPKQPKDSRQKRHNFAEAPPECRPK